MVRFRTQFNFPVSPSANSEPMNFAQFRYFLLPAPLIKAVEYVPDLGITASMREACDNSHSSQKFNLLFKVRNAFFNSFDEILPACCSS